MFTTLPWNKREAQRFVVLERMLWRREAIGQGQAREALEIGDAGIAPPLRFLLLGGQERSNLCIAFWVYKCREACPGLAHLGDAVHTLGVVAHEFIPQRAAGGHPVVPWHMMKPEQIFLRRTLKATEASRDLRRVLGYRVAAAGSTVEANALRVGAVEVGRVPVGPRRVVDPRSGAIVMAIGHLVMQSQRCHVVHHLSLIHISEPT